MKTPNHITATAEPLPDCTHLPAHGPSQKRQCVARTGEDIVAHYLTGRGVRILARNWRSGRQGELDIIAQDGRTLIAVEVKTRTGDSGGDPLEAITENKLYQLRKLFRLWLRAQSPGQQSQGDHDAGLGCVDPPLPPRAADIRIDAAAVLVMPGERLHLRYLEGVG